MQDRFKFRSYGRPNSIIEGMQNIYTFEEYQDGYFNVKVDKGWLSFVKDEDLKIMQCTGLKDKNGKLIYEGDIVQTTFENNSKIIFSVVWDNKKALFNGKIIKKEGINNYFMPNRDYLYYLLGNEKDEVEVIGNINENPELLGGEQ